jgi:transposase
VNNASVSRWRRREREQGNAKPRVLGGDCRSGRIEAQAALILERLENRPDQTTACLGRARP